mmetsp:Transcript_136808/g.309104  ORF Transcript_136808/g.309104 Transcript_136808/m.309104 type:complete len:136 (+) Transcript_136808:537-944(+)
MEPWGYLLVEAVIDPTMLLTADACGASPWSPTRCLDPPFAEPTLRTWQQARTSADWQTRTSSRLVRHRQGSHKDSSQQPGTEAAHSSPGRDPTWTLLPGPRPVSVTVTPAIGHRVPSEMATPGSGRHLAPAALPS